MSSAHVDAGLSQCKQLQPPDRESPRPHDGVWDEENQGGGGRYWWGLEEPEGYS